MIYLGGWPEVKNLCWGFLRDEALIAATRLPHRVQGAFAELGVDSTRFPWHSSSLPATPP